MDILTDCCTCWAQCISGVLLLSEVVCGIFPHPQMHIKMDTLWPSEQHPGKKCCTCCVTKDNWEPSACSRTQITCPSGKATTYTKHGYSGGKWNGTLLSSVMREGSVCVQVMDIHNTQAPPQASWCGGNELQLMVTLGVSAGYSSRFIMSHVCSIGKRSGDLDSQGSCSAP